jgi:ribonuclease HII
MLLYKFDESLFNRGYRTFAGLDEAGRGPLAGPVVASAVILCYDRKIEGINDSKKLSQKQRERLFCAVLENAKDIGIGIIDAEIIDEINILRATRLAMYLALKDLKTEPELLLIDAITLPSVKIRQMPIIKGDAKSASIAAASIIAKVIRDAMMVLYHDKYPLYGFAKHKGYPTKEHIAKLGLHGVCPIHRKSFQGVKSLLLPFAY